MAVLTIFSGEVWESGEKIFSSLNLSGSLAEAVEEMTTEFISKTSGNWQGGILRVNDNLQKTTTEFNLQLKYLKSDDRGQEVDVNIEEIDTKVNLDYHDISDIEVRWERCKTIEYGINLMSESDSVNCITFTDFDNSNIWVQLAPMSIDYDGNVVLGSLNLAYASTLEPDIDYPEFAADIEVTDWKAGSYVTLSIGSYLRRDLGSGLIARTGRLRRARRQTGRRSGTCRSVLRRASSL